MHLSQRHSKMEAAHLFFRGGTIEKTDMLATNRSEDRKKLSLPRLRLAHFQQEVSEYMHQPSEKSSVSRTEKSSAARLQKSSKWSDLDGGGGGREDGGAKTSRDGGSKTSRRVTFTGLFPDATARAEGGMGGGGGGRAEGGSQTERVLGTHTKRTNSTRIRRLAQPNQHGMAQRPPTSRRDILPGEGNVRMTKYLRPFRKRTPTMERSPGERVGHAGGAPSRTRRGWSPLQV